MLARGSQLHERANEDEREPEGRARGAFTYDVAPLLARL
jgi:hypothetical protein